MEFYLPYTSFTSISNRITLNTSNLILLLQGRTQYTSTQVYIYTHIYGISVFGKRPSRKNDNVVVFPFAFHIAVQQPFKPLWSHLLLYELEPSRASFVLSFKPLLMTLLQASVLVSLFVWRLPFDLSSKGGPASSYATAGIALRVTGVFKPPHHDKVQPPMRSKSNNYTKMIGYNY